MKTIAFVICFFTTVAVADEMWLGEWLDLNEPKVRSYLQALEPSQIGKSLTGIKLSDGKQELKGYKYIANLSEPHRGLHIYKFHYTFKAIKFEVHYIWVEKGFPEYDLNSGPSCAGKWIEPGGWGVLSGDQYTYQAVRPGENIVLTTCQLPSSNPALKRDSATAWLRPLASR